MRKLTGCLLIVFSPFLVRAQEFGGHSAGYRWRQINTDTVRVIFPPGLDSMASTVAALAQRLGMRTEATLGHRLHKISIVMQNETTIDNGYVSLGVWRSEFQLTPMQNSFELGSLPPYQLLALHEYRHVQQYNNFRKGGSRILYYLFGQEGQELANSAAIPNWFWEGDAVYQETGQSRQGRGRLPSFFNGYQSLWSAQKHYSWMKLRNGSLRDYVPDHYPLGYMLVGYGYEKYGKDFWANVTDDAARYDGLFYPFQKAIKKYSGLSYQQFRKNALDFYRQQLPAGDTLDPAALYGAGHRHFAGDEQYPQWIDAGHIVLACNSYRQVPVFVVRNIQTQEERKLRVRDIAIDDYFSYRNGKIVYAAYMPDPRWSWEDYSDLRVLDIRTGRERFLTRHTKYFAPDISADGRRIVAVKVIPGKASLEILDAATGSVEKNIPNTGGWFYTYPKFYGDHEVVSAIRDNRGRMALGLVNITSGDIRWLTPFSMNLIGFPNVAGDTITFTASHAGRDELFAWIDGRMYQFHTGAGVGATGSYQLSKGAGGYAWTRFSAAGYMVRIQAGNAGDRLEGIDAQALAAPLTAHGLEKIKDSAGSALEGLPKKPYPVTRYPQSFHLLNVHSWRPYIDDPDYTFSVVSENVLNTLQSEVYFTYNRDERYKRIGIDGSYAGFFPWINIGSSYTMDRNALFRRHTVYWDEWEGSAGLSVPLDLTRGRNYRYLSFGGDFVYNKRYFQGVYKDSFDNRGFGYAKGYLNFVNQSQKAAQQIYPHWAQTLSVTYDHAVTLFEGNQLEATARWYFPGLWSTHSLVINTAFHQRDSLNNVRYANGFPFSRGYVAENYYRMWAVDANYHLPLVYPDWGFGNIVYFLRVRANFFYDYTRASDFTDTRVLVHQAFRSYGTEIFFDTKWWNEFPVSFGFRYSRLMDAAAQGLGPNQWEFILPVNILSKGYSNSRS